MKLIIFTLFLSIMPFTLQAAYATEVDVLNKREENIESLLAMGLDFPWLKDLSEKWAKGRHPFIPFEGPEALFKDTFLLAGSWICALGLSAYQTVCTAKYLSDRAENNYDFDQIKGMVIRDYGARLKEIASLSQGKVLSGENKVAIWLALVAKDSRSFSPYDLVLGTEGKIKLAILKERLSQLPNSMKNTHIRDDALALFVAVSKASKMMLDRTLLEELSEDEMMKQLALELIQKQKDTTLEVFMIAEHLRTAMEHFSGSGLRMIVLGND